MKKKNLMLFVLTLFISICFMSNIKAEYTCTYYNKTEDFKISFKVDALHTWDFSVKAPAFKTPDGTVSAASIKTSLNKNGVQNWEKQAWETEFVGKDYLSENMQCPPYLYYIYTTTRNGGLFKDCFVGHSVYLYTDDRSTNKGKKFAKTLRDNCSIENEGIKEAGDNGKEFLYVLKKVSSENNGSNSGNNGSNGENNGSNGSKPTCLDFTDEVSCENSNDVACIWVESKDHSYCNTDKLQYVKCGDAYDIPSIVPKLTNIAINLLKIGTPIVLIIVSMIDLLKAIVASREDDMKKAQSLLLKRIIAAVLVFFVVSIVQFIMSIVADSSEVGSISSCLSCLVDGDNCDNTLYYKTNIGGTDVCTYLSGEKDGECE